MTYLIPIFISLACLPILWKRINYLRKRNWLLKQIKTDHSNLIMLDQTKFFIASHVFLLAVSIILITRTIHNVSALSLWLVISLVLISEIMNTILVRKNFYNEKIFTYYHRKFFYEDIISMEIKKSVIMANSYQIKTTDGSFFNVTREYYEIISKFKKE